MRAISRLLVAACVCAGLVTFAPAAQAAVGWTAIATGVSEDITAVDYTPTRVVFATGSGRLLSGPPSGPFTVDADYPGTTFTDIELSPDGKHGYAVGSQGGSGAVYYWDGSTSTPSWAFDDLSGSTYDDNGASAGIGQCTPGTPGTSAAPRQPLVGITWVSNSIAYAVGLDEGVVLKGGPGSVWKDVGRLSSGGCQIDSVVTDVVASPGSLWFADQNFGFLWRSNDGLASPAVRLTDGMVNHYKGRMSLAVDPTNTSHLQMVADDPTGGLSWGYSTDGGGTSSFVELAGGASTPALRSVAGYGGTFLAVGDGGAILRSIDGAAAEAIGDGTTTSWKDVDMISATQAVVVGSGGRLVITADALGAAGTTSATAPKPGPLSASGAVPVVGGAASASSRSVVVRVRGKLGLPSGVSAKAGCKGVVRLTLAKKGRTIARSSAKVKKSCVYTKKIRVRRSKVGGATQLVLRLRLTGNKALGRVSASYAIGVRKAR
ncbi:MAG: hypothetical protein QM572_09155 [Nocardioides sp.]|uniref:hypothetical protein n=1 Tax=Nocardioides sp. TaxID=35761 RepID=UPI0039E3698B